MKSLIAVAVGALAGGLVGCSDVHSSSSGNGKGQPILEDRSADHPSIRSDYGHGPTNPVSPSSPSGQMHSIMSRPMSSMAMTENVDRDFAVMMMDHHGQAIEMARVVIEHGISQAINIPWDF